MTKKEMSMDTVMIKAEWTLGDVFEIWLMSNDQHDFKNDEEEQEILHKLERLLTHQTSDYAQWFKEEITIEGDRIIEAAMEHIDLDELDD